MTGARLETGALSGITLYEPGALTLVAGAGTPLADVEAALAAEGQRLAFEPMDHRALFGTDGAPTLGGVVAANVSARAASRPARVGTTCWACVSQTGAARSSRMAAGDEERHGATTWSDDGGQPRHAGYPERGCRLRCCPCPRLQGCS